MILYIQQPKGMDMKFIDTAAEYEFFSKGIQTRYRKIYESGVFLFGEETDRLERFFPPISSKNFAVTVKNCTDAIMLVLKRVYKHGMTIILPNFGAYPTAVACKNFTDKIYYVDVDESMTIDPSKLPEDIKNGIIIPVHLFGNNCNMLEIMEYAKTNNHIVIEDCAQSTGSGSGKYGHYSVFSFYPTKPLASMGDGGMICFNDEEDLDYFKKIRFYGQKNGLIEEIGINSRMDEFQAAVVNAKLDHFKGLNYKRIATATRYKKIISGIFSRNSVYHQFTVLFNNREEILKELNARSIPYMIHYPYHLSEMEALSGIYNEVGFRVNDKIVSLPVHPFMQETDIAIIEEFLYDFKQYEYKKT
jgi:dTDP-4-amino-4,6-dideoxygalactose transaminase